MKIFLFVLTITLLFNSLRAGAQEPTAPIEKPVELKGDLKAFELIRESSDKHIKAWSTGRGRFITTGHGKRFAVRAEWAGEKARFEQIEMKKDTKPEEIDWAKLADITWVQNGRKQLRYAPIQKRLLFFLDQPDAIGSQEELHVIPSRRFAHFVYQRPWSQLMDPSHPQCSKDGEYDAKRNGDQITVSSKWQQERGNGAYVATATADWLITETESRGSKTQRKIVRSFERNHDGLIVPTKLEVWSGPQDKPLPTEPNHYVIVVEIDFAYKPVGDRFSASTLLVEPDTAVYAVDLAGSTVFQKKIRGVDELNNIESILDAHLKKVDEEKAAKKAPAP